MPVTVAEDGSRVYYEVHGGGPGVLLVHGSGGNHAAWWQQVATLADRYTVVTVDLRGFGRSDVPGPDESGHGVDVDARGFPLDILAAARAADLDRVVLVGQSIGAAAALRAALTAPDLVAGVVLAHSLGGIDHPELAELVAADRAEAVRLPVIDRLLTPAFRAARPDLTLLFRQLGTFNAAAMADLRNLHTGGPTVEELAAARITVCLLAGEYDAVLSPATVRRAAQLIPDADLEIVPGAPHSMYWEAPEQFNAAIERFLRRVYAPQEAPQTMQRASDTDGQDE